MFYVFNDSLKSASDVKKSFEDFYQTKDCDLKKISTLYFLTAISD